MANGRENSNSTYIGLFRGFSGLVNGCTIPNRIWRMVSATRVRYEYNADIGHQWFCSHQGRQPAHLLSQNDELFVLFIDKNSGCFELLSLFFKGKKKMFVYIFFSFSQAPKFNFG